MPSHERAVDASAGAVRAHVIEHRGHARANRAFVLEAGDHATDVRLMHDVGGDDLEDHGVADARGHLDGHVGGVATPCST